VYLGKLENCSLIRRISEVSCDTEDWSNYAENSAFTSQENILKLKSQYYRFPKFYMFVK